MMGNGYRWHCAHCDYTLDILEGVGFTQFLLTEEVRHRAINGEMGEDLQTLLRLYPDCVIDTEWAFFRCRTCGSYENTYRYRFRFLPLGDRALSIKGVRQLKDGSCVYHYRPVCSHCASALTKAAPRVVDACPQCGEKEGWSYESFLWD